PTAAIVAPVIAAMGRGLSAECAERGKRGGGQGATPESGLHDVIPENQLPPASVPGGRQPVMSTLLRRAAQMGTRCAIRALKWNHAVSGDTRRNAGRLCKNRAHAS